MENKDFSGLKTGGQLPDPKSIDMTNVVDNIWGTYREAVTSLLDELEAAAMELEAGQNTSDNTALIRRLLHSIKGDSGMAGFMDVHDFCHEAESVFEELTERNAQADMVLKTKDWIQAVIDHISGIDISQDKQEQIEETKKERLRALVIDDDCPVLVRDLVHSFQKALFRGEEGDGLQDHAGDFVRKLVEEFLQRPGVVVLEDQGLFPDGPGHPQIPGGSADIPVLPAVIAATGDQLPPGVGPRDAHRP